MLEVERQPGHPGQQDPRWNQQRQQQPGMAGPQRWGPPAQYGPPMGHPHPQIPQQWMPPAPAAPVAAVAPAVNVAAIVSITCGVLGMLILGIVFSPVALIAGIIGEQQAIRQGLRGRWLAGIGLVLGAVGTLIQLMGLYAG